MTGRREFLAGGTATLLVGGMAGRLHPDHEILSAWQVFRQIQIACDACEDSDAEERLDLPRRWRDAWYHVAGLPAHTPVGLAIKLRLALAELEIDARTEVLINTGLADIARLRLTG